MSTPITPPPVNYQNIATSPGGLPFFRQNANGSSGTISTLNIEPTFMQRQKAYVTAADLVGGQLISIIAAPPTIVYPPGAAQAAFGSSAQTTTLLLHGIYFRFLAGATPFTGGGAISFVYTGTSVSTLATVAAAKVTSATSTSLWVPQLATATSTDVTTGAGLGIQMSIASAAFAAGNGQIVLDVFYTFL